MAKRQSNLLQTDDLSTKYASARPTYEAFTNNIAQLIATLLRSKNLEYLAIEPRTKQVESFKAKIQRPTKLGKYLDIRDVTDLSGVRIIAYYQKDVAAISKLVEANFAIDFDNSVDKSADSAPDRFGYSSVHFIVSHNKDREKLAENTAFAGLKAEIQIRTVLQHAWAVLDRKLRYNNEEDIPREVRRKLFRVSALLEISDESFSEIDRIVGELRNQYATEIKVGNLNQEINLDSLDVFMRESSAVDALIKESKQFVRVEKIGQKSFADPDVIRSISALVMSVHLAGIKTVKQLNDIVLKFNEISGESYLKLGDIPKYHVFTTAGLIRLALVFVVDKKLSEQILRLVPFLGDVQDILVKHLHPHIREAGQPKIDLKTALDLQRLNLQSSSVFVTAKEAKSNRRKGAKLK